MSNLRIGTTIVFDTTFNHPALRDITPGREYAVEAHTDEDEPKPIIIDNSGEQNARALQICEYRVVNEPLDVAALLDQHTPQAQPQVVTQTRYIVSYAVNTPGTAQKLGNLAMTFDDDEDPNVVLRKMQYDAALQEGAGMVHVCITGVFKL